MVEYTCKHCGYVGRESAFLGGSCPACCADLDTGVIAPNSIPLVFHDVAQLEAATEALYVERLRKLEAEGFDTKVGRWREPLVEEELDFDPDSFDPSPIYPWGDSPPRGNYPADNE